jgi:hypothetical protein
MQNPREEAMNIDERGFMDKTNIKAWIDIIAGCLIRLSHLGKCLKDV